MTRRFQFFQKLLHWIYYISFAVYTSEENVIVPEVNLSITTNARRVVIGVLLALCKRNGSGTVIRSKNFLFLQFQYILGLHNLFSS